MTNRELIKQLLDEDLDAEVVIEARGAKQITNMVPIVQIQGIHRVSSVSGVILVPEGRLVVE